ncbi:prepilin peptidase [Clostridium niameyense]|uniref:Prepilin peptidase n=1 Tax=Clostridium niameyense TaxID=1622073 RepID=A0A6M0R8I7_9CLOT|nr:A24 family peptidase [Clostridium niameyense]NEZ46563.1 prepilin peptidase [Clostridium niameyense]
MKIIVFILGLIMGSFLNVCIYRIPKEESIVYPPSHCGSCNNLIKPYDLIPVISYIFLQGKCRYCQSKISIKYPIIEISTGLLFLVIYNFYGVSFYFVKNITLICFILSIAIIDLDTTNVYSKTTIPFAVLAIIFILIEKFYLKHNISIYIYGALLSLIVMGSIIFITNSMGTGDLDICLIVGLFLGVKLTAITLMLSFIFGGVMGIILILLKKKDKKDYMPFVPYIAMASIFSIFFGEKIFLWYITLF